MGQNLALSGIWVRHSWQVEVDDSGDGGAGSLPVGPFAAVWKYWANMAGIISPKLVPIPKPP